MLEPFTDSRYETVSVAFTAHEPSDMQNPARKSSGGLAPEQARVRDIHKNAASDLYAYTILKPNDQTRAACHHLVLLIPRQTRVQAGHQDTTGNKSSPNSLLSDTWYKGAGEDAPIRRAVHLQLRYLMNHMCFFATFPHSLVLIACNILAADSPIGTVSVRSLNPRLDHSAPLAARRRLCMRRASQRMAIYSTYIRHGDARSDPSMNHIHNCMWWFWVFKSRWAMASPTIMILTRYCVKLFTPARSR